ncbi:penicillin-binding protein activator [Aurantivibrio infirmus]
MLSIFSADYCRLICFTPYMRLIGSIVLLSLFLSACETSTQGSDGDQPVVDRATTEKVRELLSQAQSSDSPERDAFYLEAAQILASLNEDDWARNLLASIDAGILFNDDFVAYTLLFSRLALDDNAYFLAQRILTNPRIEQQWDVLPVEFGQILRQRRAELFAVLGESTNSVSERISLNSLLFSDEERAANQDAIWQSLKSIPDTELRRLSDEETDLILKGWYSLAAASKNDEADIEQQQANIDRWTSEWPTHPAALHLPSDLQLLRQLVAEQPRQVALLLPLSGGLERSGKAVRDGFFAAYYQAKKRGSQTPEIRVFDTYQQDVNTIYDLAVADGADMVVGPLVPSAVDELSFRPDLPVTTLALNYTDQQFGYPENLFQYTLAFEDEARQVAERAWIEGHRYAMVLIPQTEVGEKHALAFAKKWQELGGVIVAQSYFADQTDYPDVIKGSLLVDDSEDRAQQLSRLFGTQVEFEARRRQDVDFVFMYAEPKDAIQLKPMMNLQNAGDIPIYSTSKIYSGETNSRTNRDLNGIRFNTIPWVFDNQSPEKTAIAKYANPNADYGKLYALGVDAYRLYPRLKQLEQVEGTRFYGSTGALRLALDRKIAREQIWAQIVDGVAIPLPSVVSEVYVE